MTNEELQAIEARLAAATPGPWRAEVWWCEHSTGVAAVGPLHPDRFRGDCRANAKPDADLIANAPTDIAALLAEVRRLRRILEDLDYRPDC